MRGISAQSRAETLESVAGLSGDLGKVGDELFGAVAAIDGSPALRRVLTDPSSESEAKQGLAASVFAASVSEGTLAVLKTAVAGRWSAGRHLTDALETAGVAAWIRGAEADSDLEGELFEAGGVVLENAELRSVIEDRMVPAEAKASLLGDVFGSQLTPGALALLRQAAVARTASFEKVLNMFSTQVVSARSAIIATVRAAYILSEPEVDRLTAALARRYDSDIEVNLIIDPSVVGGISISIGDEVVDATMSTRLEDARRRLAG